MSTIKSPVAGLQFQAELTTTQVPIALGAGGLFAVANNVATITFNAAHGLTLTPAAGTLANYFIQFNGVTAQTGVGTLNGPIFRILSIPTATTITIYTTVTAATMTAANAVPVFVFPFIGQNVSGFVNGPIMTATQVAPAWVGAGWANLALGANCTVQYNPDNTSVIQDPTIPTSIGTLAATPTYRTLVAVSTGSQVWMSDVSIALFASGGAGTSRLSVIE
jgi:hypothetical protein